MQEEYYAWAIAVISFAGVLYIMAELSKRLGVAMQIKPYFKIYYVSILLLGLAVVYILAFDPHQGATAAVANALFATGMTLGLVATVKYWGWLIKELTSK